MIAIEKLRPEVVGIDVQVPLLSGGTRTYVNLDNASSTPTLRPIAEKVDEFMRYYSNVARGTGFKSQVASWAYEESRKIIARFIGADPEADTVIITRNTTESLNRLAALFPFKPDDIILTTRMEHSSNYLPWRRCGNLVQARLNPDGSLDVDDFAAKLREFRGRVTLVTVTGASNVTGWVNPIHHLARLAHEAGAKIAIDAAQVAPHRPIDMRGHQDPEHLDFVAFSGHKTYAPYGAGILAGDKSMLAAPEPAIVGGGVADLVTPRSVVWRDLPSREEAGTPAVAGAVAMAASIGLLEAVGWDAIMRHEADLTRYALTRLSRIPGIRVHGKTRTDSFDDRIGTICSVWTENRRNLSRRSSPARPASEHAADNSAPTRTSSRCLASAMPTPRSCTRELPAAASPTCPAWCESLSASTITSRTSTRSVTALRQSAGATMPSTKPILKPGNAGPGADPD